MSSAGKSGWTWLSNSRKWHYFTSEPQYANGHRNASLCGKFMLLALPELQQGNDDSADNCKACARKAKLLSSGSSGDAR